MVDHIGAASSHLIVYMKLVADSLWEVQNMSSLKTPPSELADRLKSSADEMERLVREIPDFGALIGDSATIDERLRAGEAEQDKVANELMSAIAVGEAALSASDAKIQRALAVAVCDSDDDYGNSADDDDDDGDMTDY
jgi:hypothetical protein